MCISEDGVALAYLPDHELALGASNFPELPDWTSGFELAAGVDLLIHDAQYTEPEYRQRVGWGHSTIDQTLRFAAEAGAKRLVTFHHDPGHSDAMLDHLTGEAYRSSNFPFELIPGTEGLGFEL